MEFIQLTKSNAGENIGSYVVFKIKETPILSTLCDIMEDYFIVDVKGNQKLLPVKYPSFIIIDKTVGISTSRQSATKKNKKPLISIHYSMNFLPACSTTILQYVGHFALIRSGNGEITLNKIRSISKSMCYVSVKSGNSEKSIEIKNTPFYVIV